MQDQRGGGRPPKARVPVDGFVSVLDAIDFYAAHRRAVMQLPEPANPVPPDSGPLKADPPRISMEQVLAERDAGNAIRLAVRRGDLKLYSPRTGVALPSHLSSLDDVELLGALVRLDDVVTLADPWGIATAVSPPERASTEKQPVAEQCVEPAEVAEQPDAEGAGQDDLPAIPNKPRSRAESQDAAILAAIRALEHDPLRLPPSRGGRGGGVRAQVKRFVEEHHASLFPSAGKVFQHAWDRLRRDRLIMDRSPE